MNNIFKEFEKLGTDKEDIKFKYKRGYKLEERIEKLIEKETKIFPKTYHNLVYLDSINFQLFKVNTDIKKYADQWATEVENIAKIECEEINDEMLMQFYGELSFLFYWLVNGNSRCTIFKNNAFEVYKET